MNDKELMRKIPCTKKELEMFKRVQKEAFKEATEYKKRFFENKIRVLGISGSMRQKDDCPKEESTSEWLLEKCLDEVKKLGAETKIVKLREYSIESCKGCYSTTNAHCHFPCSCYPPGKYGDDMTNKIYDLCLWADVIVFATPIHNFKISSMMSLFIDRLISMDGSLKPANPNDVKNKELNIKHTKFIELTANKEFGSGFLRRFTGKIAGIIVSGHEVGAAMTISSLYMTLNHFGMLFPPFNNMYAINTVCEGTYEDKEKLKNECYEEEARGLAKNLITAAKVAKRKNDYWWVYDGGSD